MVKRKKKAKKKTVFLPGKFFPQEYFMLSTSAMREEAFSRPTVQEVGGGWQVLILQESLLLELACRQSCLFAIIRIDLCSKDM